MPESLTFNQFQKELRDRGIDPKIGYMLSIVYEQQIEVNKQVMECMNVLTQLADTVGNVVELHAHTQEGLRALHKSVTGEVDGVHVSTEPGKGN